MGLLENLGEGADGCGWSLLDSVPDGVIIATVGGEIVFANVQAGVLFGSTAEGLVGRSVDELLPEEIRGAHRAHRNRYRAHPEVRSMGAGLELRARRLDGSEFFTEISLSPLRRGEEALVLAAVRDITARVAAEDHLHRVLLTLDSSDDGVFMFDAETLIYAHVNDGAVRLVGYGQAELFEMTPVHLNPYASEAEYRDLVEHLLADPDVSVRREARLLRSDGVEVPVEKTYRAAPPGRDGTRWIIASARDVSERLAAEEELARNQDALRQAEQVMVLAEDRDRIARDLHDTVIQRLFGTGLGLQSAMGLADGLLRERLEATIDDIDDTIRELRSAIFSLQGASRAMPGGVRGRLLDVVTQSGHSSGIEPRVQFDGPIESLSAEVADQLVPTLREALSNVAKHAHAHNVRVSVSVLDGDATVIVIVIDDGVGVSGEVLGGHGLQNLTSRANALGGSCELTAMADGGSRLAWSVPTQPDRPDHSTTVTPARTT